MSRPPLPPGGVLVVAVGAMAFAGPLVRYATAPALAISAWRLLFSVAFLAGILLARGGFRAQFRLSARQWGAGLAAGVLLAGHFWAWIASLGLTTVASSVVLVNTQPLFVGVFSLWFLKEPPSPRQWLGIWVAVVGAGVIGWGDWALGGKALVGDALALGAALMAAGYYAIGRSLRPTMDLWAYAGLVYGVAALALTGAVAASPAVSLAGYPRGDWLVFLALALGPMMLGHTGMNYALRYLPAYVANLAALGEPVGATFLAWILPGIGEAPSWNTMLGGGLVLSGIALGTLGGPQASRGPPRRGVS